MHILLNITHIEKCSSTYVHTIYTIYTCEVTCISRYVYAVVYCLLYLMPMGGTPVECSGWVAKYLRSCVNIKEK